MDSIKYQGILGENIMLSSQDVMRLTALCVCGTLLALSTLSWTTADSDEGDLLGDHGFGPCAATLRPEGLCRHGQDESTCPYRFSLPPLTVYLPKPLRELEKIVKDLQKLKDSVDQLRKMCADCTVSQTERECGSARELRVKINQVAAFLNNSLSPNGRRPDWHSEHPVDHQGGSRPDGTDSKLPTLIPSKVTTTRRDCSDHLLRGETQSGVYLVTPDLRSRSFPVFCDMEMHGGGWTLLQRRQDGSVSFNRTWAEYRSGFGELNGGEFWLGNNMIHLLTRDRDMVLRVELEDFDGVVEYAEYKLFRVASERMRYRLTVGGFSGTAGDALRFSKSYDHNNRAFTTPDRDHDRYPSGNCGAYYSSGWWFDACMAANLNGRYYVGTYKGVRDGIYWGTWHSISTESYPTNDRQSFKSVSMMIRPKGFTP
ncbi:fibroleukin-like [Pempheris klunzingeri]|uniref:fibroleukin-like n=1 Tax=Pempheris klunzingeri TaxID=3127111 RepID=UPI0039809965